MAKAENGKKIIDIEEFKEAWRKGLVDWNSREGILEEKVAYYHEMGNRELEEQQVNNEIAESQLANPNTN